MLKTILVLYRVIFTRVQKLCNYVISKESFYFKIKNIFQATLTKITY